MKAIDLIDALKKMPPDLDVWWAPSDKDFIEAVGKPYVKTAEDSAHDKDCIYLEDDKEMYK